ncbi:MAG: hypothetical protein B6229_05095 [Spirochaetaceae bacterium 4572_7]|nr:MAG: hypothetical protein B6229_05095 [Spirochaetaceae bacterium 4572_7]
MGKNYFITGIKHCGKSTIGKKISKPLNLDFLDLDNLIESNVKMGVREFYKNQGRENFMLQESNSLKSITQNHSQGFVCATGGGICDNPLAFNQLKKIGYVILLIEEFDLTYNRILAGGIPAFLTSENPKKEFYELYIKRLEIYRTNADIIIECKARDPEIIKNEIIQKLEELHNVRK